MKALKYQVSSSRSHGDLLQDEMGREIGWEVKVLVSQSRLTLCDPMDSSPPGTSVPGIFQYSRKYWSGSPFLLQRIFPTQGSNTGLPH